MKRINKGKQLAIDSARLSKHDKRVGACVMKKNKVLGVGWNSYKTHTKSNSYCKYQHAEFNCLIGLDKEDLIGATIFVARLTKTDKLAIAKPCKSCQELIDLVGIKKVFYIQRDGEWNR